MVDTRGTVSSIISIVADNEQRKWRPDRDQDQANWNNVINMYSKSQLHFQEDVVPWFRMGRAQHRSLTEELQSQTK